MIHNFTIPGLDRSYCSNCKKWILSEEELKKIKLYSIKTKDKQSQKDWIKYLKQVEYEYHHCKTD